MKKNRKQYIAFTLAEVLITLGIIGIVAALTMPALVGKYKKRQTITHLQKVYTTLNQALKLSEATYGPYEYWETGYNTDIFEYYEKYWYPHFKILKSCNTEYKCGYKSRSPWQNIDGSNSLVTFASQTMRIPFITADGTLISISVAAGNTLLPNSQIFIDLNGSKNPNTLGIDVFWLERVKGKGILPDCYNYTEADIDDNCKTIGNCCFAKIIKDGWQIKDDYPWK